MRTLSTLAGILVAFALAATGCSKRDVGRGRSGVGADKHLSELSEDELATLCDWQADRMGGYGQPTPCGTDGGMSSTMTPKDRTECMAEAVSTAKDCSATVSQVERCTDVVVNSPCDLKKWFADEDCRAALRCYKR